jgi:hypothetical protein
MTLLAQVILRMGLAFVDPSSTRLQLYRNLLSLADLCVKRDKKSEAESFYKRSLAIREKLFGPQHPVLVKDLGDFAVLLRSMNRVEEAEKLDARAKEIQALQVRAR